MSTLQPWISIENLYKCLLCATGEVAASLHSSSPAAPQRTIMFSKFTILALGRLTAAAP